MQQLTIDKNGAGEEKILEGIEVQSDRRNRIAKGGLGLRCDLLQDADDVQFRLVSDLMSLPIARLARPILSKNAHLEMIGVCVPFGAVVV